MFIRSTTFRTLTNTTRCLLQRSTISSSSSSIRYFSSVHTQTSHHNDNLLENTQNSSSSSSSSSQQTEGVMLQKLHQEYFSTETSTPSSSSSSSPSLVSNVNLYDIRSGSYTKIAENEQELKKYFPEGLAGELQDEMNFTKQKQWMIRDSTKLLCRLIEEVEPKLKNSTASSSSSSSSGKKGSNAIGLHSVITLDRLTNRSEWEASKLQISRYGKDIANNVTDSKSGDFVKSKGEHSFIDTVVKDLEKNGGIPDKIMLTGK